MVCFNTPTYADRNLLNTTTRSTIGGYPIKYEGSGGCTVSNTNAYAFHDTFVGKLDKWMGNVDHFAGIYGGLSPSWIGHMGTYRAFSGNPSWHYRARAWDISSITWTNGTTLDMCNGAHASSSLTTRRRYLAVEALLRRHFRTVLNGYYNADHENHFHVDNGCQVEPLRKTLRSHTLFIQLVANNFMSRSINVDGTWGTTVEAAYQDMKDVMGLGCLQSADEPRRLHDLPQLHRPPRVLQPLAGRVQVPALLIRWRIAPPAVALLAFLAGCSGDDVAPTGNDGGGASASTGGTAAPDGPPRPERWFGVQDGAVVVAEGESGDPRGGARGARRVR